MAVLEAMASGLPVIVADEGAPSEIVGKGGLLFRSGDSQDLAEKVNLIKDDPKRRVQLWRIAAHIAKADFSWQAAAKRYVELYSRID